MTGRVGPKGQVVIPKTMRDRLGILPGDLVRFEFEKGGVRVEATKSSTSLRGSLRGLPLSEALQRDRTRERQR